MHRRALGLGRLISRVPRLPLQASRVSNFATSASEPEETWSLADFKPNFNKRIGVGGFGSVYRGVQSDTGLNVAIKTVLPACSAEPWGGEKDLADAIAHEREAFTQLLQAGTSHPHVVDVVAEFSGSGAEAKENGLSVPSWLEISDPEPDEELSYFVMEHLEGKSLEEHIKLHRGLREEEVQEIALGLTKGLLYLHAMGVLHRDVKPSNVFYSSPKMGKGTWKLIDFSASTYVDEDIVSSGAATLRERVGTPGYIAPEIMSGKEPYGPKADVFSLGCIVHAMLTNLVVPRRHISLGIVTQLPQRLSQSGRDFVNALLTIDPAERPTIDEALSHPWLSGGKEATP